MEPSVWSRFGRFIQESYSQKFKYAMPGCIMGFIGSKSLLWAGLPSELLTLGAYVLKYMGTVFMAFSSGLATAFAAHIIEQYKENKNTRRDKKKNKAA